MKDICATAYYGEYKNYGSGSSTDHRVTWPSYHVIKDVETTKRYTIENFIIGNDWLPNTGSIVNQIFKFGDFDWKFSMCSTTQNCLFALEFPERRGFTKICYKFIIDDGWQSVGMDPTSFEAKAHNTAKVFRDTGWGEGEGGAAPLCVSLRLGDEGAAENEKGKSTGVKKGTWASAKKRWFGWSSGEVRWFSSEMDELKLLMRLERFIFVLLIVGYMNHHILKQKVANTEQQVCVCNGGGGASAFIVELKICLDVELPFTLPKRNSHKKWFLR
ncbi:pectin lyase fold/virulence factor, Pectin lyase fold protein [Artemisia annua]|uniref:Pectin lyase fold/virulence factor, Pectin lyase fold protein n=1 Tax=Artemisia annua TaxID=35608 RepID=A0A2U1Q1S8_ARTAN|nr:pectin lyase fold/virulence factor, Pectin lyase fold protein [Artemisia annua]